MATSKNPVDDLAQRKNAVNRRQVWTDYDDTKLRLMAGWKSQREIAVELGRSLSAVETRARSLRMKYSQAS
jgi:NAD+--asparagine ADP-ribosyltransferase